MKALSRLFLVLPMILSLVSCSSIWSRDEWSRLSNKEFEFNFLAFRGYPGSFVNSPAITDNDLAIAFISTVDLESVFTALEAKHGIKINRKRYQDGFVNKGRVFAKSVGTTNSFSYWGPLQASSTLGLESFWSASEEQSKSGTNYIDISFHLREAMYGFKYSMIKLQCDVKLFVNGQVRARYFVEFPRLNVWWKTNMETASPQYKKALLLSAVQVKIVAMETLLRMIRSGE